MLKNFVYLTYDIPNIFVLYDNMGLITRTPVFWVSEHVIHFIFKQPAQLQRLARMLTLYMKPIADPKSFVRGGPNLAFFFSLMRGERVQIPL